MKEAKLMLKPKGYKSICLKLRTKYTVWW